MSKDHSPNPLDLLKQGYAESQRKHDQEQAKNGNGTEAVPLEEVEIDETNPFRLLVRAYERTTKKNQAKQ